MSLPVLMNLMASPDGPSLDELVGNADAAGCDGVGLADSPRLLADPFVSTEIVLSGHALRLAGPCVAALGLRPTATVASALGTLSQRHPGRVLAVVGRGESAVRNEGLPVPSLREHGRAMAALRERLAESQRGRPAVLLGAGSGPRTIELTAATLDGVLVDVGADLETVGRAVSTARTASHEAVVWLFLRAVVTRTEEQAVAAMDPILGSCAARLVAAPQWYGIDDVQLPAMTAVAQAHDYRRHGSPGAGAGSGRSWEAEALVRDRFLLSGGPEEIAARLRPFAELGISGVVLAGGLAGVRDESGPLVAAVRAGLSPDGPG
ncbi:MAG: LLM class flavin-dependent oxidoreductase [Actinomycetota bacterium]|nr:LLM class flavin-dependent oxidoreductase [Actinomycetota bacterium]